MLIRAIQYIKMECESIEEFEKAHPKAQIKYINDREVCGLCEGCGKPVLDTDKYEVYADGVIVCANCYKCFKD